MHILSLSLDGNIASLRQTMALAGALAETLPGPATMQHFSPLLPPGSRVEGSNLYVTWKEPLSAKSLGQIAGAQGIGLTSPWPDIVVSCRPEVAAVSLGIKEASGGKTKVVQIQNPNDKGGLYRFNPTAFDVIVAQPQENVLGANVVTMKLALHGLTPKILDEKRRATHEICRDSGILSRDNPVVAVFVGGADENMGWGPEAFTILARHIKAIAVSEPRTFVSILTSRRTGEMGEKVMRRELGIDRKGRGRLSHWTDQVFFNRPKDYMALLTHADAFIVTAESLSMVSEAVATGKPVFVDDLNGLLQEHPLAPIMKKACDSGMVLPYNLLSRTSFSEKGPARPAADEAPSLARTIVARLGLAG